MKERLQKVFLDGVLYLIALSLVTLILVYYQKKFSDQRELQFNNAIQEKLDSIKVFQRDRQVLLEIYEEQSKKVLILTDSLNILEKQRKTKEREYEERVYDIDGNSLAEDVQFLTKYLSQSGGF